MHTVHRLALIAGGVVLTASIGFAAGKTFSDQATFASWFAPSVQKMEYNGVITGYPDGSFGPGNTVTRAELAVMLDRFATALKLPLDGEPRACTMQFVYGLNVYLQDNTGKPLTGASITVNGAELEESLTGENGQYALLGEMEGYFTVAISKDGYSTYTETIKVEKDACHVIPLVRTVTLYAQD